ncbi:MAG: transglutaminase family protein [Gordonia sp. (in: high G+C Gram-positive bacteria)]
MTTRLRVVHTTGFSYAETVASSYNEARLTPRGDSRQSVVAEHIEISPTVRQHRYTDYWGTTVTAFDVHTPHERLVVTGTAVVETDDDARSADAEAATWEMLRTPAVLDEYDEWLTPTAYTPVAAPLSNFALAAAVGLSPVEAVAAVVAQVDSAMTYQQGATEVHFTALDVWERRTGVCQDFAHVTLAMIRSLGIPARYVSGYLLPRGDAAIGESVDGESHAWIEVWTGTWWALDPTNNTAVSSHHVAVGTGRDYADVTPIKGIYTGGGSSELDVKVAITRLA